MKITYNETSTVCHFSHVAKSNLGIAQQVNMRQPLSFKRSNKMGEISSSNILAWVCNNNAVFKRGIPMTSVLPSGLTRRGRRLRRKTRKKEKEGKKEGTNDSLSVSDGGCDGDSGEIVNKQARQPPPPHSTHTTVAGYAGCTQRRRDRSSCGTTNLRHTGTPVNPQGKCISHILLIELKVKCSGENWSWHKH